MLLPSSRRFLFTPVSKLQRSLFSTSATSVLVNTHSVGESKVATARRLRQRLLKEQDSSVEGSLIAQTLAEMESDPSLQFTLNRLKELGQEQLTREEKLHRRRALDGLGVPTFEKFLQQNQSPMLRRKTEVFQINIGLYCNQACTHCHVESSPKRVEEQMSREVVDRCLEIIAKSPSITTVDITGGAPELNKNFRYLATESRKLGKDVIDRCNLTVLSEPEMEDLPEFLSSNGIHVVASLPCYSQENVDQQRGRNVYKRSIRGLLKLNEAGYAQKESGLKLDLVYNPVGGFLPPEQKALEDQYRIELREQFGIEFSNLFTITNMPIKRFADHLLRRGELKDYMQLLVDNFNPAAVENAMCTTYLSVDHQGLFYDCDFNQQLKMSLKKKGKGISVFDVLSTDEFLSRKILMGNHCFGCVSGAGSSCQGATA